MVAVASAAVVFNVILGLCLHGTCCTGLPHGHSHGGHTRLAEEGEHGEAVNIHAKERPGRYKASKSRHLSSGFLYLFFGEGGLLAVATATSQKNKIKNFIYQLNFLHLEVEIH